MGTKYVIDTSSLIEAWNERYSIKVFQGLWYNLEEMNKQGDMLIHPMVRKEISVGKDDLVEFVKELDLNKQTPEKKIKEINKVLELLKKYEGTAFAKENEDLTKADIYLIACADLNGYTVITEEKEILKYIKITEEKETPKDIKITEEKETPKDIKIIDYIRRIPDVCMEEDISCTNFHEFMIEEGWKF